MIIISFIDSHAFTTVLWGLFEKIMSTTTVWFSILGRLEIIQTSKTLSDIPTLFIILLMVIGFISHFSTKYKTIEVLIGITLETTSSHDND